MPFDLSETPVIIKRELVPGNFAISISMERKLMIIECPMQDTYESGAVHMSRPKADIRNLPLDGEAAFTNALNEILPNTNLAISSILEYAQSEGATIQGVLDLINNIESANWLNPRQTFLGLVINVLKKAVVKTTVG